MSVIVTKAVWERSRATGATRLVLLALASHVINARVEAGEPALAWPSQQTLAEYAACRRSTVQLALEKLQELGEIENTGERRWGKYNGTIIWELFPNLLFSEVGMTDLGEADQEIGPLDARSADEADQEIGHKQAVKQEEKQAVRTGSVASPPDISTDVGEQGDAYTRLCEVQRALGDNPNPGTRARLEAQEQELNEEVYGMKAEQND